MNITVAKEDLDKFEHKLTTWFYGCLNDVVPKMSRTDELTMSMHGDYRDHCASLIKAYVKDHPQPTWKKDL